MKIAAKFALWGILLGLAIPGTAPWARAEWTAPVSWAAAAPGTPEFWCKRVFDVNQRHKHMVGNQYVSNPPPGAMKGVILEALGDRETYIAHTPPEIREDVKNQVGFYDRIAKWGNANNWNLQAPGIPRLSEAEIAGNHRLFKYQVDHCGLNPTFLALPK